jgi:hypothetical protein
LENAHGGAVAERNNNDAQVDCGTTAHGQMETFEQRLDEHRKST